MEQTVVSRHIIFYSKRIAALLVAVVLSLLVTSLIGDRVYPIGWIYIALFSLASLFSFIAAGTYMWITAVWLGAMLVVLFGGFQYPGDMFLSAIIIGIQFLSAVMTGGLLGQWLAYRYARKTLHAEPVIPSLHALLTSGAFLLLLPVLAFVMLAGVSIKNESLQTILMFVPGNTPFLFPALLTAALCGYWVRNRPGCPEKDKTWASLLIVAAVLLVIIALFLKLIFGFLVVTAQQG